MVLYLVGHRNALHTSHAHLIEHVIPPCTVSCRFNIAWQLHCCAQPRLFFTEPHRTESSADSSYILQSPSRMVARNRLLYRRTHLVTLNAPFLRLRQLSMLHTVLLTQSICPIRRLALHSIFEGELADVVPVIHCSIAGCSIVGRLCAGNRHGLLVPNTTTDTELQHLRNCLPDEVKLARVEERLSALGNVIAW